jgi:hypothetical protein
MTQEKCNHPLPECIENFAEIKAQLETLLEKTGDIQKVLRGNGREGLIIRTDRLEQTHNRSVWISRVLLGAVLLLVVNQIWLKVFPLPTSIEGVQAVQVKTK